MTESKPLVTVVGGDLLPLISVVTPTRGRPQFLPQAYRIFARQTYPERELVLVADEDDRPTLASLEQLQAQDARVRTVVVPARTPTGAKRNAGILAARGDHIVSGDDDDWFGRRRLEYSVMPLLKGQAHATLLIMRHVLFVDTSPLIAWEFQHDPKERVVIYGCTLAFCRDVWEQVGGYPDLILDDDIEFDRCLRRGGFQQTWIDRRDTFVHVRHHANVTGRALAVDPPEPGFNRIPLRDLPLEPEDWDFYRGVEQ